MRIVVLAKRAYIPFKSTNDAMEIRAKRTDARRAQDLVGI